MSMSWTAVLNADLHCHSTVSDGLLAPADVVAELERREGTSGIEEKALRKAVLRQQESI